MTNLIEIEELSQSFRVGFWLRSKQILHSVSFSVPASCAFGFLGSNGAGKTTLIHLLTGQSRPTKGSVRIFGADAHSIEARSRIGYLPERPYFYEHLTGEALLRYYGVLSGWSRQRVMDRIPQVLSWVGLSGARHIELRSYSKGMLQRIGIAQALLHDPELLILDEPMSGLDPQGRQEVRELMLSLVAQGRTLFFSSHIIADVEAICHSVAWIDQGKLLGAGPLANFLEQVSPEKELILTSSKWSCAEQLEGFLNQRGIAFMSAQKVLEGWRVVFPNAESLNQSLFVFLQEGSKILAIHSAKASLEGFLSRRKTQ